MSATPKPDGSTSPDPATSKTHFPNPTATTAHGSLQNPQPTTDSDWINVLRQHVASLRFGVIQVVIHEGRVVQIERTEKYRIPPRTQNPT